MLGKEITVQNTKFTIQKFLGRGKSGYSYLITNGIENYVYKQIHHEPCEYYNFGDKLDAELWAYKNLLETGIKMPKIIEYNEKEEYLIKEYIDGKTAAELASENLLEDTHFESIFELAGKLHSKNINVDFFPTNFVYNDHDVFLIDYEFNQYNAEWNFENWGIYFWLNGEGMKEHLANGFSDKLCMPNSPKPIKDNLEKRAQRIINKYAK